jgi:hypothetical protein
MACLHGELSDGVQIHICRLDGESRPARKRRKMFWCFQCRKRLPHTLMGFYPTEPSYYGPSFSWECPRCHEEHVLFPGREWVYDE